MYRPDYEISILCDGSDHNKTDRLSALLREFAQEENLSVHITVRQKAYVSIRHRDGIYRCHRKALRYVTSDRHYCICHTTRGDTRLRVNFRDAAEQLLAQDPNAWLVVNRGILVAIDHIASAARDCLIMDDGTTQPISRKERTRIQSLIGSAEPPWQHPDSCQ